jgi:hypothetical protein
MGDPKVGEVWERIPGTVNAPYDTYYDTFPNPWAWGKVIIKEVKVPGLDEVSRHVVFYVNEIGEEDGWDVVEFVKFFRNTEDNNGST